MSRPRIDDDERSQPGPWGVPEGARAPITDGFVEFDVALGALGLATRRDDRSARVLVGKKGSGKTLYLRRFQDAADKELSVYADVIHQDPPSTELVMQMGDWFGADLLTEKWMAVWKAAILQAAATHLQHSEELGDYVDVSLRQRLERYAEQLYPGVDSPRSVYACVSELIGRHERGHHLTHTLMHGAWRDLEYHISRALQNAPPICFYIDAVDEEYGKAPSHWLRCQKGLFYQVMRFLRDGRLGGRLHIVICIRDVVFSSVLRSEHATRYRLDPHIRALAWDAASIRFFVQEKLDALPARYFADPDAPRTWRSFIGVDTVHNTARRCDERIEDYLLRHTRLIPRDVVELGNLFCRLIDQRPGVPITNSDIEAAVRKAARWYGSEQLGICANQLKADQTPAHAVDHHYSESYTAADEWSRGVHGQLEDIIGVLPGDQFGPDVLADLAQSGLRAFGPQTDVVSVLWQNGLIGYADTRRGDGSWVFYGLDDMDAFHMPLHEERYALHPCVIDATGVRGSGPGTTPVVSYRRTR
jgi:hypothetical protein